MKIIITFLAFTMLSAPSFANDVERGFDAFDHQKYKKAVEFWTKAAIDHEPTAEYQLALMYLDGIGVDQDIAEAKFWLCRAVEDGSFPAANILKRMSKQMGTCLTFKKKKKSRTAEVLPDIIKPQL